MLGKLIADSGGAQRIAMTLVNKFGEKTFNGPLSLPHSLSVLRYFLK